MISVGDKKFVYKGSGSNSFTDAADLAAKLNDAGYTTTVSTVSGKNWSSWSTPWGTWLAWSSMAWADWIRMLFLV